MKDLDFEIINVGMTTVVKYKDGSKDMREATIEEIGLWSLLREKEIV